MRTLQEIKEILAQNKERIREKYGVLILGLFGSYARGEESETSDVDILVEIEKPIGLDFIELWDELERLLGIKVDLVTVKSAKQKPALWESIKEELINV